ncbi:hypothetical protein U1Q18_017813, partial [Sarracenia purpurea var. burkii]
DAEQSEEGKPPPSPPLTEATTGVVVCKEKREGSTKILKLWTEAISVKPVVMRKKKKRRRERSLVPPPALIAIGQEEKNRLNGRDRATGLRHRIEQSCPTELHRAS